MNIQFNNAALKCLEAAKMVQAVKDTKLHQTRDDINRRLWQIASELLLESPKAPKLDK
jgi:hypothetical protein